MKKKNINFTAIILIVIFVTFSIAGVLSVKIALDNPAYEDDFYIKEYDDIEDNISSIMSSQKKFNRLYKVAIMENRFKVGDNNIKIHVAKIKNNQNINSADVEVLITRPDSSEYNIDIKPDRIKDGVYEFNNFNITKTGRWKVIARIKINNLTGYTRKEILAL